MDRRLICQGFEFAVWLWFMQDESYTLSCSYNAERSSEMASVTCTLSELLGRSCNILLSIPGRVAVSSRYWLALSVATEPVSPKPSDYVAFWYFSPWMEVQASFWAPCDDPLLTFVSFIVICVNRYWLHRICCTLIWTIGVSLLTCFLIVHQAHPIVLLRGELVSFQIMLRKEPKGWKVSEWTHGTGQPVTCLDLFVPCYLHICRIWVWTWVQALFVTKPSRCLLL